MANRAITRAEFAIAILKIVSFSTLVSVAITSVGYYAFRGFDHIFWMALAFAIAVPIICSLPVAVVLTRQRQKLASLNAELRASKQRMARANKALQHEASHDGMTGILNREYFLIALDRWLDKDSGGALLLIDVDHFKEINDQFGHLSGDKALKVVAQTIQDFTGPLGLAGRIGGEEFAAYLPYLSPDSAVSIAEALRKAVEQVVFVTETGVSYSLTVTIGIGLAQHIERNFPTRKADLALYAGKSSGRNQSVVFDPAVHERSPTQTSVDVRRLRA